jgi:hypothetical protein
MTTPSTHALIASAKKVAINAGATCRLSDALVAGVWSDILRMLNVKRIDRS